jgi:hypothetical protein
MVKCDLTSHRTQSLRLQAGREAKDGCFGFVHV